MEVTTTLAHCIFATRDCEKYGYILEEKIETPTKKVHGNVINSEALDCTNLRI